jgi:hypothetical protein
MQMGDMRCARELSFSLALVSGSGCLHNHNTPSLSYSGAIIILLTRSSFRWVSCVVNSGACLTKPPCDCSRTDHSRLLASSKALS